MILFKKSRPGVQPPETMQEVSKEATMNNQLTMPLMGRMRLLTREAVCTKPETASCSISRQWPDRDRAWEFSKNTQKGKTVIQTNPYYL